jgi:NADH-quinone oxidoreductase subunit N
MNIDLIPYSLELGVTVLLLAMIVLDSFLDLDEKGAVWGLGSVGLLVLLGGSFLLTPVAAPPEATWALDPFALYFKQFFLVTALFSLLGARAYAPRFRHGEAELYSLLLFATLGGMMLASTMDWISLFVALELMTVTLFILVSWNRRDKLGLEAGMKYVIIGTFSSAFLLYGITYLYGFTGTTRLGHLREFLVAHKDAFDFYLGGVALPAGVSASLPHDVVMGILFGVLLVTTGLLFKMAAFPFHIWAPDVYEGSPAPVTGFLGVASKGAGFILAMRLGLQVYAVVPRPLFLFGTVVSLMSVLAAITLTYGSLAAIPQWKTKRLMGYSSISHAGYLMIGLAVGTHLGAAAVCYYLLSYCFTSWGLFLVLCALDRYTPEHEIADLAGLGRRHPLLGVTLACSLLSMAGIPPFSGFFGKLLLLMAAFDAKIYWLGILGMLMAVVSMFVYLSVLKNIYSVEPTDETPILVDGWLQVGCYVACTGMVVVGIFQGPFLQVAEAAARSLM